MQTRCFTCPASNASAVKQSRREHTFCGGSRKGRDPALANWLLGFLLSEEHKGKFVQCTHREFMCLDGCASLPRQLLTAPAFRFSKGTEACCVVAKKKKKSYLLGRLLRRFRPRFPSGDQ